MRGSHIITCKRHNRCRLEILLKDSRSSSAFPLRFLGLHTIFTCVRFGASSAPLRLQLWRLRLPFGGTRRGIKARAPKSVASIELATTKAPDSPRFSGHWYSVRDFAIGEVQGKGFYLLPALLCSTWAEISKTESIWSWFSHFPSFPFRIAHGSGPVPVMCVGVARCPSPFLFYWHFWEG